LSGRLRGMCCGSGSREVEAMGDERGGRVERKDEGREFASCKIDDQFEGIPFSNNSIYSSGMPVSSNKTPGSVKGFIKKRFQESSSKTHLLVPLCLLKPVLSI